jgi:hypothetical protein
MDLTRYVDSLRQELAVVAAAGGEEAQALAERLTAPLESSIRLMLLDALSSAAAEITSEIAPGSVHLRLRGQQPDFVVSRPTPESLPEARPAEAVPGDGPLSRINMRLPDELKARVDEAAAGEGLSINAWLVRAVTAALDPPRSVNRHGSRGFGGDRYTGWAS